LREAAEAQLTDELLATQENLITLIDALPDNVIFKDGAGRWLVVNPPAAEFFQLKGVPWIGKTDAELAKEIPALKDLFAACIRSDEAGWAAHRQTRVIERGPGPDGRMQEHEVHKVPLFNPDGSRHALLVIGRDVTEKRRLEDALRLSELMASQSRDALLLVRSRDGRIVSANAAAVEFYGYTREKLPAKTIYDLRQNNDVALAAHQLSQAFASGILFETVHVHKDGHTIPVEVSSHGTNFAGEGFLVSSIRDITVRKKTESKLLQLEQSMAAAANGIFLVKPNGKIFWVNAAFTRMTGYSAEEATGKNPRFLKSGQHDTGFYRELWQTILAGKVWQAEIFNRRKDGTIYPENKTITPVIGADGKLSHFICVQEDITERKQAEKAMVISENKFRTLYEQAPVGIFQSSLEGRLLAANPTMARIFGYANPAAMLADGENVAVRFYADPKMRPAVIAQLMTSESGLSTDQEIQLRKRDGTIMVGRIQMRLARTAGTPDYIEGFIEDISTRVAAELELQTSEERYRQLVNNARDLIFILGPNGTFISVNPVVERMSGLGGGHWIGKPFTPLVHPDDLPLAWDNFHRVMKGEVVPPYELRGHPDLLQRVEMEITLFARTNAHGEIIGVMGIGRDITLRKQAEAQMRLLKTALAAAANGIFLADVDGKIFWVNDAFTRLTGYSEGEALGQTPKLLNSKQHSPEFFQRIWTHILAGHYWQGEVKNRRKDGTLYDEYQTVTPVKDASGKVTHFICVQEDITNRKQMEMENARLAAIVTSSDDAIIGKQLDGTITTWNQGAEKIFGFTAAEMVGTSIRRIIPAERQTDEDQILAAIAQGEAIEHFETIRQTKDGRLIDVSITASPIKDAAGKITGVSKVARDITERKLAELRLTASENKFRGLYESITDGIVSVDMAGQIREFNPAYVQMLGYSDAELVRLTYQDLTPEKWHAFEASIVQEQVLPRGFSEVYEKEYRRKDGTVFPVELRTFIIKNDAGQITGMWATVHDITVRKQAEVKIQAAADFNQETIDSLPEHLCVVDEQGKILTTNDAWKRFTLSGSTPAQNADVGANYLAICDASVGPEMTDAQTFAAGIRAVIRGERDAFSLEYPCHLPTEKFWFLATVTCFKKHVPIRVVITHKNITARKQAEENIRENEARLRTWFEMPLAGIAITSPGKGWLQVNDRLCEMLGYTREELYSMTWAQITHPDDLVENAAYFDRVVRGETEGYAMEKRFLRKNGEFLTTDLTVHCTRKADGEMDYFVALIQDISNRKQAERELLTAKETASQKSALLKSILESPQNVVIFSLDANYCYTEFTQSHKATIKQIWGADIAVGVNMLDIIGAPADRAKAKANFDRALRGESFLLVEEYGDRSHRRTFFEDRYSPIYGANGEVTGLTVFVIDITERKQAEAALIKARDFHLQLFENAPTLIWRAGTDAKCDWFNQTWFNFTGRTMEQEFGDGWAAGVHPDDLDDCVKRYLAHFKKRESFMLEYRLRRHDGEYRWIADHGQPFDLPGGGFGGYIGYCYDIHDIKLAQELLEKRVADRTREIAMLSEVIDQSAVGFSMSNPDGSFITVNESYARLTGYTRNEILGNKLNWNKELTPPEWRPISAEKLEECLRTRQTVHFEKEYLRKDGSRVPVEVFVQPIYEPDDKLLHLRAFVTNISERKQAEVALQKSQARERLLAEVIDTSEMAFCVGTADGKLTLVNQAFEKLTGYNRQELTAEGFNWIEKLTPPQWREAELFLLESRIRTHQPISYEKEFIHKDGHIFPVELFIQPVFDPAGKLVNFRVFVSNISERKKIADDLNAAVLAADRANLAKSDFLAAMSHEIRTPMNIILGNTQLLQRISDLPEEVKNKIATINRSGEHLLTILNDILDLAKVESGQMELHLVEFELSQLLNDLTHLFNTAASVKRLALTLKTDGELPEFIKADKQKIQQILNNLLSNAVKYTITGSIELVVSAQPDAPNKVLLIFAVVDTGPGIAAAELNHLFENFQQGKAGRQQKGGTGLGLAISSKYAALMQGRIDVQSKLGKGSTFQLEVPVETASNTSHFGTKNLPEASRLPIDASAFHKKTISAKLLAALPPSWSKELREALLNADADKITALLKAVEPHDSETAKCLLMLASEFDYENILQQLDTGGL